VIYLDYNATTPLDSRVFEAMSPYMKERWGNPSSPYSFGIQSRMAVENARVSVADHFSCSPGEVIFTSGGTESDNLAVRGVAQALRPRGNHIITTSIEHHAVLHTCRALEKEGYHITYLPVGLDGAVKVEDVEKALGSKTVLVSIMHANNETGVIQPIEEIAALAKKRGAVFHTDAVQTVGKIPFVPAKLGADLISISGHKLYGPKGTGALYVREGTPLHACLTGGPHEHSVRAGTENVAGIVGLAHALTLAMESLESECERLRCLRDLFESRISAAVPGSRINGASAQRVPNTSSISFEFVEGESIVFGLDLQGICASTGSACSTGDPEPSHVLLSMGLSPKEAQGSIRISLGKDTREEDIGIVVGVLTDTITRLRGISSIAGGWSKNDLKGNGELIEAAGEPAAP
jgi:cysteine desulfurase